MSSPEAIFIAGSNGAGKSTVIESLASPQCDYEFVNADVIASEYRSQNFSAFAADLRAGKDVLRRLRAIKKSPINFIHETTLVSTTHQRLMKEFSDLGFKTTLWFVALDRPELAEVRVARRVEEGGHPVPVHLIGKRWLRGLQMFFQEYIDLADSWTLYDNSSRIVIVATGGRDSNQEVFVPALWQFYSDIALNDSFLDS